MSRSSRSQSKIDVKEVVQEAKKRSKKQPTQVDSSSSSSSDSDDEIAIEIVKKGRGRKPQKQKEITEPLVQAIPQQTQTQTPAQIAVPMQIPSRQRRYNEDDDISFDDVINYMSVIDRKVSKIRKGQKRASRAIPQKAVAPEVHVPIYSAPIPQQYIPESVVESLKQQMLARF